MTLADIAVPSIYVESHLIFLSPCGKEAILDFGKLQIFNTVGKHLDTNELR